jgi:hypothetical protein
MPIHSVALRGANTIVVRAGLAHRCRGLRRVHVTRVQHGVVRNVDSRRVRLSYSAAGSPPGRSVRPHPSRNRVSPATSLPSTRKHWLPACGPACVYQPDRHLAHHHHVAGGVRAQLALGNLGDDCAAIPLRQLGCGPARRRVRAVLAPPRCRGPSCPRRNDRGDSGSPARR